MHGPVPSPGMRKEERMTYDYSKLKGRAREKGMTLERIQKETGISSRTLSAKWNGKGTFTQAEMKALKVLLDLDSVDSYFFVEKL